MCRRQRPANEGHEKGETKLSLPQMFCWRNEMHDEHDKSAADCVDETLKADLLGGDVRGHLWVTTMTVLIAVSGDGDFFPARDATAIIKEDGGLYQRSYLQISITQTLHKAFRAWDDRGRRDDDFAECVIVTKNEIEGIMISTIGSYRVTKLRSISRFVIRSPISSRNSDLTN